MKTAMTLLLRGLALTSFLISGAAPLAVNYDDNEAAISTREKREAQTSFPGSQSFSSASRQFSDFTTSSRIGPRFSSDIFEARISEGSERGGSIGEVTASSPNGENVEYFLQTNETSSFLTIDRNSGKLILREDPRDVKEGVNLFTVVASSSTGGNATARVKVRVSYSNRHRPVFTNCNQTASVFEQDTSGPFLFRIQATDEDLGINGQEGLKYSIIQVPGSAVTSFRIEENTGEIFANRAFDRDEPENERKLTIPIRVVDGGTPPLDNVCVLPVEVKDVNDNEPLFDRSEYEVSVPNDREVGSEVLLISATDIDDAENAQITFSLEPDEYSPEDVEYFRIDSGQIHLNKPLNSVREGTKLRFMARAQDSGRPPKSATVKVTVSVVEPALKAPTWVGPDRVRVPETFIQYEIPIANFSVTSNSDPAGRLYTEILRGQSENTNSKPNFGIRMENNVVYVYLVSGSPLDYERITNYDLTLTALDVTNKLRAEKNLHVEVEPMNDNAPIFGLMKELVVLENEPEGTLVGTVVAEDKDAWDDHNRVSYSWANPDEAGTEIFSINPRSGEVTTRKKLDREEQDFYILNIMASDNYPSAIKLDGSPNNSTIQLLVKVKDVNDNPPIFEKDVYDAEVLETMVNRSLVLKVRAVDADESSELIYSITGGNEEGRFSINERNGEIRIANDLDYEKTQRYSLTISVSDAKFFATTTAKIAVKNVADEPPKFESSEYRVTIAENTTFLPYELLRVKAHDPEGGGSVGYFLQAEDEDTYRVESDGTLFLRKALDRDAPNGKETWDVRVWAHTGDRKDELVSYTTVYIALTDINDNAPFLVQIDPPPLVWEDSCEGCPVVGGCKHVAELRAKDNDGPDNGAPFSFALDVNADPDITRLFRIEEQNGKWILYNQTMFDREKQKQYRVPIIVTDSPKNGFPLSATSYLKVVIGDCNDNEMFDGYSEIFVMNYKNQLPQTKIGRVFVEDADDWDLNDKTFQWESLPSAYFDLDSSTGDVLLVPGYGNKTQHLLHFKVYDRKWDKTVSATVNVTIQIIPAEAASDRKAGSIRFMNIDQGMFIDSTKDGWSRMEELKRFIGDAVGYPPANVDVLSIRTVDDDVFHPKTDVRFAVHGSPYMAASKLNWEMTARQIELKQALKLPNEVDIELIGVSECLEEKTCESSCVTVVQTTTRGYLVGSNRTSLLAVDTWTEPHCACEPPPEITFINGQPCARAPCRNGGYCVISSLDPRGYVCECPDRFNGPDCELMELGFSGDGYALMNALPACNDTEISMAILTDIKDDAILMYNGPVSPRASVVRKDVFSLELREGRPVLIINYGDRTGYLESRDSASRINDGNWHMLSVRFGPGRALISVDGRDVLEGLIPETREHKMLNVNGPLQLGGVVHDMLALLGTFGWEPGFHPTTGDSSFKGCLANCTINGKIIDFADAFLKSPEVAGECRSGPGVAKVATWKAKPEFYVAITGCLAGLLLLLLVLVFIKRRHYDASWEDGADEHSRDTLGTYSEEGGGEGDTVTYDPHLLKVSLLDDEAKLRRRAKGGNEQQAVDNAEIASFLDNNKRKADDGDDDDQDDVRHYAYEGQGSSVGSLSSLSSDGLEEPVDEDFLCRLGPEFRKLADMYKGSESDSDEPVFPEEDVYGTAGVRQRRMGPIGGNGGGGGGSAVTGPVPPESWC